MALPTVRAEMCARVRGPAQILSSNYRPKRESRKFNLLHPPTMSAYKQAGISLNRAMAIAAKTVRNSLKADLKVAAEKRGITEVKVAKYENGKATEPVALEK